MKITGVLFLSVLLLMACNKRQEHNGKTPVIEVSGQFLYQEDLQAVMPVSLSKDDSLLFAEHYIKEWVEGILLYDKATDNIPDSKKIDELVENYRKALIVHTYQQKLIEQRLSKDISEKDLNDYYETNKSLFIIERPLIKGLFIKVPLKAPGVNKVRSWYKTNSQDAIDKLEKYSLQNAVSYDYFYDRWLPASEVIDKIPLKEIDPGGYLDKNRHVEVKDSAFYYFLNVEDYLGEGQQKPFEFAKKEIKDILINLKRVSFMQNVKDDLYKNAVDKKKITYYY